ncbi:MAG: response regulator transcription factor [Chloroflexi bacterium]|nr:response regulator transcription factor [Chloroflexota bacterium]
MTISILLADDHPIVRHGLRTLLEAEPDIDVIGEADDGLEAIEQVEHLQPDVLVLDLMMPGLNGLEVTRQVGQRSPDTQVVILSMYASESYVLEALRNGAAGYVLKKSSPDELVQAVREIVAGRTFLSQSLSARAIEVYRQKAREIPPDSYDKLTNREREVLHMAAEGQTNAQIGDRLSISRRTVEMHRANMMRKLDLNTQTDLVRYALQRGILPMEASNELI